MARVSRVDVRKCHNLTLYVPFRLWEVSPSRSPWQLLDTHGKWRRGRSWTPQITPSGMREDDRSPISSRWIGFFHLNYGLFLVPYSVK